MPALGRPLARDNREISLRDAFEPDGGRQRLLGLTERHARAMPR
ncbi:hypothetical protein [Dactylosporangium sp. NPDC051484]